MSKMWSWVAARNKRGEGGAILIMATAGVVVAVVAAALAVDLGTLAQERRRDQKIADLAALDAIRFTPAEYQAEAEDSAERNGFPTGTGYSVTAVEGTKVGGSCLASVGAGKVCVTVTSPHKNNFIAGGATVQARAVAGNEPRAQFSIGSKAITVDTTTSPIFNAILGDLLNTSSAVNVTALGYTGLMNSSVSLAELVAADSTLGSPNAILTNNTSLRKLALASATVLANKGAGGCTACANAATALGSFASTIDSAMMLKVGDILSVDQPSDPAVGAVQFNIFDLLSSSGQAIEIANGDNLISVPGITLGFTTAGQSLSATLKLHLIEAPKFSALGPAKVDPSTNEWVTKAKTSQMGVDLDATIHVETPILGCIGLCVDLTLPLRIGAAEARGSLTDIRCALANPQFDVLVSTASATASAATVLAVKVATVPLVLPPIVNVSKAVGGNPNETKTFTAPFPTAIQSTAATGAGLTQALTGDLSVLGINLGPVLSLLSPVTTAIDNKLLGPIFDAFGLAVGGADVRGQQVVCSGAPILTQ